MKWELCLNLQLAQEKIKAMDNVQSTVNFKISCCLNQKQFIKKEGKGQVISGCILDKKSFNNYVGTGKL